MERGRTRPACNVAGIAPFLTPSDVKPIPQNRRTRSSGPNVKLAGTKEERHRCLLCCLVRIKPLPLFVVRKPWSGWRRALSGRSRIHAIHRRSYVRLLCNRRLDSG
jgi:hypothetical protein